MARMKRILLAALVEKKYAWGLGVITKSSLGAWDGGMSAVAYVVADSAEPPPN
jgi:hypothetical protein